VIKLIIRVRRRRLTKGEGPLPSVLPPPSPPPLSPSPPSSKPAFCGRVGVQAQVQVQVQLGPLPASVT